MLIDKLKELCDRLNSGGWKDVMAAHGLQLDAANLFDELTRKDLTVDRGIPGFEDFSLESRRAIVPGNPARSLLYHALASPNVLHAPNAGVITRFPDLVDLETVENFVFSVDRPSLDDLKKRFAGQQLAVVVFTYEYRTGNNTCHHRYADLCFSRTGVSRVGTEDAVYDPLRRGFLPKADTDLKQIRVLPARYAPFIAVRQKGDQSTFCPMRFIAIDSDVLGKGDDHRDFWLPIHKLFPGSECLAGIDDLDIDLIAEHVNEKIRRIHLQLSKPLQAGDPPRDTGWGPPDIDQPPFKFTADIAQLSRTPNLGAGVLMPVPHPLVEPAVYKGKPLYFKIPSDHPKAGSGAGWLSSSMEIAAEDGPLPDLPGPRHAPEYVNARHRLTGDNEVNLNEQPDLEDLLNDYSTPARHYIDWTGDGWIAVESKRLSTSGLSFLPAYSLVTAPDFFPNVEQRQLTEWSATLPAHLKTSIWQTPPDVLSDQRFAANIELIGAGFDSADDTVTAVVPIKTDKLGAQTRLSIDHTSRHTHLPDDSAGVFAPGWDVSFDNTNGVNHFAAYGLGSPFPEDAKLCAALSTFWPGAAPDATRTFSPGLSAITVSPLTDEEIGETGALPWDGEAGPVLADSGDFADYLAFERVDYVDQALAGNFSLALTSHVDDEEYENRVLAMAKVYEVLAGRINREVKAQDKEQWLLFSFRTVTPGDPELLEAERAGAVEGDVYRFEMIRNGEFTPVPDNPKRTRVKVEDRRIFFVGVNNRFVPRVLSKQDNRAWVATDFHAV